MSFSSGTIKGMIGDAFPGLKLTEVNVYCNLDTRSRTLRKVTGLSYQKSTDFTTDLPQPVAEKVLGSILLQCGWMRFTNLEDADEVVLIPREVH